MDHELSFQLHKLKELNMCLCVYVCVYVFVGRWDNALTSYFFGFSFLLAGEK